MNVRARVGCDVAVWRSGHGWKQAGDFAAMIRPLGGCQLSSDEQREYDRLASWWLTWTPPTTSYDLGAHTVVLDPVQSHDYLCERIREGMTGQPQRAALTWMRAHWERFGRRA